MSYSNYYAASKLHHGSMSSIMGTQLDVLMIGNDPTHLQSVWTAIETEVKRLDKMLNRFDPESEVSRINREAKYYPVAVNEVLWKILQDCLHYYKLTNGYFDITLQDFGQVLLSETDNSVFFFSESLHIDLGGVGKGYALSKIQQLLNMNGIEQALVNFGNSSVLAVGAHPCGRYWPVGLDNPYTKQRIADLQLCDCSLSISGNMPSHPQHIVNPHTGLFMEERKLVSVIAQDPVVAEVLTTTFMIAEEEEIPMIANQFDIQEKHLYKL